MNEVDAGESKRVVAEYGDVQSQNEKERGRGIKRHGAADKKGRDEKKRAKHTKLINSRIINRELLRSH